MCITLLEVFLPPPFLHSPPPDTTSRPKHCHLHKVLKRELTEQGRWYRPTDTEEGGPRADTESYYTPTDWHTHTHTPVTPVSRPVQRRTLAWAEAQLKPRTPCWHHRGELTLTSEKCIFQCKRSELSRARPWEIKRIIWHLPQSTGKLNLCSKCYLKAFVLFFFSCCTCLWL